MTLFLASASLSILLLHFFQTCYANCIPSACGIITDISYPFRVKADPKKCGDRRFELACENDVASLSLNSQKYYVKEINYHNSTIRLVDASINNTTCSFPIYSAYGNNFTHPFRYPYVIPTGPSDATLRINLMSCPYPLKNPSLFTQNFTHCASSFSKSSNLTPRYSYIKLGHMNASEIPERCSIDVIFMTSWKFKDLNNASLSEIHKSLLYGFELRFCPSCGQTFFSITPVLPLLLLILGLICGGITSPVMTIGFIAGSLLLFFVGSKIRSHPQNSLAISQTLFVILISIPRLIIFPIALWFLIYKFRRRHLSMYNTIENFLQSDNTLAPIRYSYSDIKKITRGFKCKLGEGGFGFVYKGKIRSGRDVAVKLLKKPGADGKDFINEISTIGRIHHVNIVKLVGYCAQGTKRALVFDFMPNGSLEKYLFNQEKENSLNLETKFDIAIGVAHGIEYLHRGCDVQILHFDIKPHNVLLDDKFVPKISDFGLAKFCSTDKNTVTMTAARGTIGYVAPELISRSIGAVSYKADVYSFGMLLMEIVSLKKDLTGDKGDSNLYFPYWIYDCFNQGKDIEIENDDNEDSTRRLVRKITIVALWCIQMCPNDRPSMNKVLEMLESDVEHLELPDYPSQSSQTVLNVDQGGSTYSTDSVPLLSYDDASSRLEITVQN